MTGKQKLKNELKINFNDDAHERFKRNVERYDAEIHSEEYKYRANTQGWFLEWFKQRYNKGKKK